MTFPQTVHPIVAAAAEGRLPDWAEAGPRRREHMSRVSALLGEWADALGLAEADRVTWRSAGHLHDVLRDAPPTVLRPYVPPPLRDLPDRVLHGPAAAERLREAGVDDDELLGAVAFHTVGDASLGRLGRALYAADFLEPGRPDETGRRAHLRSRAPEALDDVVYEVARARLGYALERGAPLHPSTVGFWNAMTEARA